MNTKNSDKVFRLLFVFAFLLSLALLPNRIATAQVYPPGMVSYWKFDEGSGGIAGDSIGDNNGIIYGATWTTGQVGGALSFDGVDDYVDIPFSESLNPQTAPTMSAWVKLKSWENKGIMSNYECSGPNAGGYFLAMLATGKIYAGWKVGTGYGDVAALQIESGMVLNEYYHIVASYDNVNTVKIYVNGNLVGQGNTGISGSYLPQTIDLKKKNLNFAL